MPPLQRTIAFVHAARLAQQRAVRAQIACFACNARSRPKQRPKRSRVRSELHCAEMKLTCAAPAEM